MNAAWSDVAIAAIALAFTVLGALLRWQVKNTRHQTKMEDKLDRVVEDLNKLVIDKDKVHLAIFEQQKIDRDATDKRLRYIEEFWMNIGRKLVGRFPGDSN